MAKVKKSKPKSEPDMRITFATTKLAVNFAASMESEYASCSAKVVGERVDIKASEAILPLIKLASEDVDYRRTGISIFNPCLLKKGNHKK